MISRRYLLSVGLRVSVMDRRSFWENRMYMDRKNLVCFGGSWIEIKDSFVSKLGFRV